MASKPLLLLLQKHLLLLGDILSSCVIPSYFLGLDHNMNCITDIRTLCVMLCFHLCFVGLDVFVYLKNITGNLY